MKRWGCSLFMVFILLLACGTKVIDVNVSVTDPNDKPLPAEGVLEDRTQKHTLNFTDGIASAMIAKPKGGEEIALNISSPGYQPKKIFHSVAEGETIRVQLEPLPPRIEVTKTVDVSRLKPTEMCNVEIIIANTGEGIAQGVTIKDRLPQDFEYVTILSSSSKLIGPQTAGGSLGWNLESLSPAEAVKISYRLRLSSDPEEGERLTEVLVSAKDFSGQSVPDQTSAAIIYAETLKRPKLSVEKTITPETIKSQTAEVKCTIVLENSGNGQAEMFTLEDHWPKGFVYKPESFRFDVGPSAADEIVIDGPIGNTPLYLWQINVLPAASRLVLTYTMTIDPRTIEGDGESAAPVIVVATDEQGESLEENAIAWISVDESLLAARNTDIDVPIEMDAPKPQSGSYAPNPRFGSNRGVGVNRPGDSGGEDDEEESHE